MPEEFMTFAGGKRSAITGFQNLLRIDPEGIADLNILAA
jgi:hypothetical protein